MKKISAEKKRAVIKDYDKYGNYSEVARRNKLCRQTVKRVIEETEKDSKNGNGPYDVMEHISKSSKEVCELIDKYLAVISDNERLESAPLNQVASTLGVLIDKFSKGITKEKGSTDLERVLEAVRDIE